MKRLRELRIQSGLTQDEVASKIGVTRASYSNIENGKRETNYQTLVRLADMFSCSIDYLLGHSDTNISIGNNSTCQIQSPNSILQTKSPINISKPELSELEQALIDRFRNLTIDEKLELVQSLKTKKSAPEEADK